MRSPPFGNTNRERPAGTGIWITPVACRAVGRGQSNFGATRDAIALSRRDFALGAAALSFGFDCAARAAPSTQPLIAWMSSSPQSERLAGLFRTALSDLGYVDGISIRIESRVAPISAALRTAARDLVARQAAIIVANGRAAARAAQEATAEIPIVLAPVDDPYEFVARLSHPEGNITGISLQQTDIDAKQIEFLKAIVPEMSKIAIIYYHGETYYSLDSMASGLGIQTLWIEVRETADVGPAFAAARADGADGFLVLNTDIFGDLCDTIARKAIAENLPVAGSWQGARDARFLLTYSANDSDLQTRAAAYVHRLLSGARLQDLPIEQVTKFELGINLVAASTLGLTVPLSVLVRADSVIE